MTPNLLRLPACLCIILSLELISRSTALGQTSVAIAVGNSYAFTVPTVAYRHYLTTHKTDTTQKRIAQENFRFTVVDTRGNYYIIKFPLWKESGGDNSNGKKGGGKTSKSQQLNEQFVSPAASSSEQIRSSNDTIGLGIGPRNTGNSIAERLFFAVPKQELEGKVYRVYPTWGRPEVAAGSVIIPIKMRFSEFDFSRDFALGFTVGPRWRISSQREHYLHLLGAFNVNIVTVDSANTAGVMKRPADKGALGFALGGVLDFNGAQLGAFVGTDWLGRRDRSNWVYQGKPWVSLGLGFTIFSRSSNAAPTGQIENKTAKTTTP
jgi:hypothetical protein